MREDFRETLCTSPLIQITDFSKVFILYEFGHSSANARDAAAAAAAGTVCGPGWAA
jgi:hypothetical protein